MAACKAPIEYFVFMKAETTGRQWEDSEPTKIVELCLIAVNRRDLERGTAKVMPAAVKLSMIFCPERNIQEQATDSHDLTVSYVRNTLTFKKSVNCIVAFLEQLPKPVCLVAHNGNAFDYKHLKGECINAGIFLPEDLLCVDSMWLFYQILKSKPDCDRKKAAGLQLLYKIFFNEEIITTTAEEKVLYLLKCALFKRDSFLVLAEEKCKLFSEVLLVGEKKKK